MTGVPIGHKVISASAGSGKTFQLAHRYIELMSKGVKPERIIALTFSRKAAGEIFDSVVNHLCKAASSPQEASRTANHIRKTDIGQPDFLKILRELLEGLPRLHIGTLDSFTVGIARAFPMELGIPPSFQLLGEEGAAGDVRQQVLAKVFGQGGTDQVIRNEFLEAYKQTTFGQEEKELGRRLDSIISEHHGHYQVLPQAVAWGQEDRIWVGDTPWWKDAGDIEAVAVHLIEMLSEDGLPMNIMERWQAFVNAVLKYGVGSSWPKDIDYLLGKLSANIESLREGDLSIKIDKYSQQLSREEFHLVQALMAQVVGTEISVAQQKTRGIYRLLDLYERFYDIMLRRQGQLTFNDVQYLLTAGNRASGGLVISRIPSSEARLYIDYRLDCKLDHWLLDEFQDTSDLQWEVLQNLADEILQDSGGERSFFYVGDTKQAIYGWRGGNARLFDKILDRYGDRIELSHLSSSFRSCPAVIEIVNRVFGYIPEGLLPEGAVRQWERSWKTHRCEEGVVPAQGYSAVIEPSSDQGNLKPSDEERYRVVAGLLKEVDPLPKGLSVAVLVRSNKSGEQMVDYLRRECPHMNILHEGRASLKDNPVVSVLLSMVKFAAHPGDMMAWRHLEMSPLCNYFTREGLSRQNLSLLLLRELQTYGFQVFLREWGERLNSVHEIDGFGRKRLGELVNAAIEFDRTGSRECNAFLRFIDLYEIHDLASSKAIRVMTIHQSKGLGFDIVMLPDLQGGNMRGGGQPGFVLARDEESEEPMWALDMPKRIVAQSDEVLAQQMKIVDETSAFDNLCLLYVAMTRAKQGLYVITAFPGKTSKTLTPATFLKQQLTGNSNPVEGKTLRLYGEDVVCLYETGDSQWYIRLPEKAPMPASVEVIPLTPDFLQQPSIRQRLIHVQPSKSEVVIQRADSLFAPAAQDKLDLGKAIHELFERISWIDEVDIEALIEDWFKSSSFKEEIKARAVEQFRLSLASEDIRQTMSHPGKDIKLWRERPFEVVLGDRWVSGVFDRVVIKKDNAGRLLKAIILDFKSDNVIETELPNAGERYRSQLSLYGSALSHILHLDQSRIELQLVFTQLGKTHILT